MEGGESGAVTTAMENMNLSRERRGDGTGAYSVIIHMFYCAVSNLPLQSQCVCVCVSDCVCVCV